VSSLCDNDLQQVREHRTAISDFFLSAWQASACTSTASDLHHLLSHLLDKVDIDLHIEAINQQQPCLIVILAVCATLSQQLTLNRTKD
jgi:hypothetical protein